MVESGQMERAWRCDFVADIMLSLLGAPVYSWVVGLFNDIHDQLVSCLGSKDDNESRVWPGRHTVARMLQSY